MIYLQGGKLALLNVAIGLGTFIQILDTSIANVAIPYIAGNMNVSADEGTWVITSFAASNAIMLPLTGWLADYFGRVRLFVWSVLLFALTSLMCGLATSLEMLVIFRVLQGAVAGSLIPLSQGLLVASNPPEKQGSALGFWAMIVIVAPVLGPIIGGYITEVYSWPWIFFINIPIGIFSALVTWIILHDHESEIKRNPIDWTGLALLVVGVACLQVMLDKGKDLDWFDSNIIITLTIISVISLGYFCIWNTFQKYPIVNFNFFRYRNFTVGTICITIGFLVYFASTVTVPLWLQTEQNYTPYWAGVAVAPIGLVPIFVSTLIGKYMGRFDLRFLAASSFILFAFGMFYQARFITQVDIETIMFSRFLQGFGMSIFFLPIIQLSLSDIPTNEVSSASGVFNFIRMLIGSGFGTSLSIELWTRRATFHQANLSTAITAEQPMIGQIYSALPNIDPTFTDDVITRILNRQVEQQAYMLSTNELSWLGAWLFLLLVPLIFLCKPSKKAAAPVMVGE